MKSNTYSYQDFLQFSKDATENEMYTFDADFASCGDANPFDHSRRLVAMIQKQCFNTLNPALILGRNVYTYFQYVEMVGGFLLSSVGFRHVGNLSSRSKPIEFLQEISACKSCGNADYPDAEGRCTRCKSPHKIKTYEFTIPIFSTTVSCEDARYDNAMILLDGKKGKHLTLLNNWMGV